MRYAIPLIIFLGLCILLFKGLHEDPHALTPTLINKPAPSFEGTDLLHPRNKHTVHLFEGHVSLLNVWATWCITCHAEHPVLMDIAATHLVTIYGLNYKDDTTAALKWLKQYGNPYQAVIADPQGQIGIDFGVYGTPETFIIDAHGVIRYKHVGAISPDDWVHEIKPEIEKWLPPSKK